MVFAVNPTAEKGFDAFKSMAIQQNGTAAATTAATAAATSTAVTVVAAPPNASSGPVSNGSGQSPDGNTCACQCLCAVGQFPPNAGIGSYGGFPGSYYFLTY
jgi:hypothetical protein